MKTELGKDIHQSHRALEPDIILKPNPRDFYRNHQLAKKRRSLYIENSINLT